ncbi:MAG: hypothetical protein HYX79_02055 [Chloroflexi bacterium]|nr:hypothetical protein [Chloroflexota bacterium]
MNFLEELTAEWFTLNDYFVRTNLKFGKRPSGGWVGEMDVAAFNPMSRELVHVETSMDADRWEERSERMIRKFDDANQYYSELFTFPIRTVSRIVVAGFSSKENTRKIRGDIESKTCPQLINEIGQELLQRHPLRKIIPETLPLLRAMQFAVHWGPQSQVFHKHYKLLTDH